MLDKLLDKDKIKEEHVQQAYDLLKQYCEENNHDVVTFVNDKSNIESASQYIHKQLPFGIRLVLKPPRIAQLIQDNHDFIVDRAKFYSQQPQSCIAVTGKVVEEKKGKKK